VGGVEGAGLALGQVASALFEDVHDLLDRGLLDIELLQRVRDRGDRLGQHDR
jgi:hypothetical protein